MQSSAPRKYWPAPATPSSTACRTRLARRSAWRSPSPTASVCHGPSGMAFQGVGEVTCSLGEVKNRAALVIFWGSNPAESHPRHWGRYSTMPKGQFVPNGRKDRTVVLVDVRRSKSAPAADIVLRIKPRKDFEALWALRALVKGVRFDASVTYET